MLYRQACHTQLPPGLYMGYLQTEVSYGAIKVQVSELKPNCLPCVKIRSAQCTRFVTQLSLVIAQASVSRNRLWFSNSNRCVKSDTSKGPTQICKTVFLADRTVVFYCCTMKFSMCIGQVDTVGSFALQHSADNEARVYHPWKLEFFPWFQRPKWNAPC